MIELDRIEGVKPRPAAIARFLQRTALYTDKPEGITLIANEVIPADAYRDGSAPLKKLAIAHRDFAAKEREHAGLHVIYAPRWNRYRGYAWGRGTMRKLDPDYEGALIYLFSGAIKPLAWITGTKQEASVLIHELGHTMGLATDPGHSARGHCTNAHCLMYDGVDVRTFFLYFFPTLFTGYLPLDFCSDCRSDLWEDDGGIPPGQREGEGRASRPPARPSSR